MVGNTVERGNQKLEDRPPPITCQPYRKKEAMAKQDPLFPKEENDTVCSGKDRKNVLSSKHSYGRMRKQCSLGTMKSFLRHQ